MYMSMVKWQSNQLEFFFKPWFIVVVGEYRIRIFGVVNTWNREITWWLKLDLWLNWPCDKTFTILRKGRTPTNSTPSKDPIIVDDIPRLGKVSNISFTC